MSSNNSKYRLFSANGCLNQETIQKYLSGSLSNSEKIIVNKHIKECPLCADAVEGARIISGKEYSRDIEEIKNRISLKTKEKKTILFNHRKRFLRLSYISAAASIVIILSVFFYIDSIRNKSQLAVSDKMELDDTVLQEEKIITPQTKEKIPLTRQKNEINAGFVKQKKGNDKDVKLLQAPKEISEELVDNDIEIEDELSLDNVEVDEESEAIAAVLENEKVETKTVEEKAEIQTYAASSEIVAGSPETTRNRNRILESNAKRSKEQYAEVSEVIVEFEEEETSDSDVFYVVEEMPKFKGKGLDEFRKYIQNNLKYPESASESGISGRVYVSFVINKRGKVKDVKIVRSVDAAFDKEAIRVVKSSPNWTPGKQRGENIKVAYTIPIEFRLQ